MLSLVLVLSILSACGRADPFEECRSIPEAARRDECLASTLPELFRKDPVLAEKLVEETISDPQIRDFVYLTVTRQFDPGSYTWCEKIKEPALVERCRVIVSRPHLHRELLNLGSGSGQAGPPPGSPPPGPLPGSPPPEGAKASPHGAPPTGSGPPRQP